LIALGVRCVVAAGWAVDDEGARVFAEPFYDSMLDGDRFIDAVCYARTATYRHNPDQNTWAAYQCYGDPDWIFRQEPRDANRVSTAPSHDFSGIASAMSLKARAGAELRRDTPSGAPPGDTAPEAAAARMEPRAEMGCER